MIQSEGPRRPKRGTEWCAHQWQRLVMMLMRMLAASRAQLVVNHHLQEDLPHSASASSEQPAPQKQYTRRRQLSRSKAKKTWDLEPMACPHSEEDLYMRGNRTSFWWTCQKKCGSRWTRLECEVDSGAQGSNSAHRPQMQTTRYPANLPPPARAGDAAIGCRSQSGGPSIRTGTGDRRRPGPVSDRPGVLPEVLRRGPPCVRGRQRRPDVGHEHVREPAGGHLPQPAEHRGSAQECGGRPPDRRVQFKTDGFAEHRSPARQPGEDHRRPPSGHQTTSTPEPPGIRRLLPAGTEVIIREKDKGTTSRGTSSSLAVPTSANHVFAGAARDLCHQQRGRGEGQDQAPQALQLKSSWHRVPQITSRS